VCLVKILETTLCEFAISDCEVGSQLVKQHTVSMSNHTDNTSSINTWTIVVVIGAPIPRPRLGESRSLGGWKLGYRYAGDMPSSSSALTCTGLPTGTCR
jgi:hypothetical protein